MKILAARDKAITVAREADKRAYQKRQE